MRESNHADGEIKRVIVGVSGASGAIYGVRLVEALLADPAREVHLIVSAAAERVARAELGRPVSPESKGFLSFLNLRPDQAARIILHANDNIGAAPASGTFRAEAMAICPCSMKTLAHVAAGLADSLIARAADVTLKEGRRLVLVPRETPLSLIHLRNMTALAEAGAVIAPAMPGFYHQPQTIDELVGHVVQKVCDRMGVDYPGAFRWSGE